MREKSRKEQQKDYFDWHHLIPTSRLKKRVRRSLHVPWHTLFTNKMSHEAIEQVEKWTTIEGKLTKKLGKNKLKAWKIVFGEKTLPKEAIEIIKKRWSLPKRDLYGLLRLLSPKEARILLRHIN